MILIILSFLMILKCNYAGSTKCKILALDDGDDLMVYEAAALKGLFDNLPTAEADYDVITGQSFSAISAVFFATYPKG
jgi:hypothetical protein